MTLIRLRHLYTPYEIIANKKRPPKEAVLVCSSSESIIQRPMGFIHYGQISLLELG